MLKFKFFLIISLFCTVLTAELKIGELKFEGNHLISDRDLSMNISTSSGSIFNQILLNKDVKHISEYYSSKGLYNIKVHSPQIITNSLQTLQTKH